MLCEGITPNEATFNAIIREEAAKIAPAVARAGQMGGATYYVIEMCKALEAAQRIVMLFDNHWAYGADVSHVRCPCGEIPDRD
jgi:hypothetical protein